MSPAPTTRYAVPSGPNESHGSSEKLSLPPLQVVAPGRTVERKLPPPSLEEATAGWVNASCTHARAMLFGSRGLTASVGSASASWCVIGGKPGQGPTNWLRSETG